MQTKLFFKRPIIAHVLSTKRGQSVANETLARLVESSQNDFLVYGKGQLDFYLESRANTYARWYRLVREYRDVSGSEWLMRTNYPIFYYNRYSKASGN